MKTVPLEVARSLISFAPDAATAAMGFAEYQIQGAVAAYNQLARNRVAYLADEVGMGKTYIALGTMGLLRHFEPDARIMVIAPRENLQTKWIKELENFVERNWLVSDNRVKSIQGGPARIPHLCGSLRDLVTSLVVHPDRDFYLRMTSFSVWTSKSEHRRKFRKELRELLPWVGKEKIPVRDAHEFRVAYGRTLNAVLPDLDLLVIDEGHNLKHGYNPKGSTRNALLAAAFGRPGLLDGYPELGIRAKRLLLLSATPFEHDYADLWRQLDLFGLGEIDLLDADGGEPLPVRTLREGDRTDAEKRRVVERFLTRRVGGLLIGGEMLTKNQYRREWRQGGLEFHDEPMAFDDPRQRLVVGLVQKKVAEVLGSEKFNNRFQIGMLSSFESFIESATGAAWQQDELPEDNGQESPSAFDGRQTEKKREKEGIDTWSLSQVVRSYRERFGGSLPHPKLDATVADLSRSFDTGEKALVFVRRIATMGEIKARLDERYNEWIRSRMISSLPRLRTEIDDLFSRFEAERKREEDSAGGPAGEGAGGTPDDDRGGRDSFFAWFFRGDGPSDVLSGAAFHKNRLASRSSAYSVLFEEDLVSWLLGRPADPLTALAEQVGKPAPELVGTLRRRAFGLFRRMSDQKERYPRLLVFDAYQNAAMDLLRESGNGLAKRAEAVLHEKYDGRRAESVAAPEGFPGPDISIGAQTFFSVLAGERDLERELLPVGTNGSFREEFRERECRRELLSAMFRLGAAYIDLYLLAIDALGSFSMGQTGEGDRPATELARALVRLLSEQRSQPGFHAYRELAAGAEAFETLVATNFHEIKDRKLSELPKTYATWLMRQVPVATPRKGALARLVRQFRMPGYPLVLVTTDILQEGEDLHTFCRKVIHYGITWTSSAMEQRTGRVDRIGSLVQRRLDGQDRAPPDELIQVHYPHLRDTVELLQVRRVFHRMNRFLRLMHKNVSAPPERESTIDADREFLAIEQDLEPFQGRLESAFPVSEGWLRGEISTEEISRLNERGLGDHLGDLWRDLKSRLRIRETDTGRRFTRNGTLPMEGGRAQTFEIELRSSAMGDTTLLRCRSPVGGIDLNDRAKVEELERLQQEYGLAKICSSHDTRRKTYDVSLEGDVPFDPSTTQPIEVEALVLRTARVAHGIACAMLTEQRGEVLDSSVADIEVVRGRARQLAGLPRPGVQLEFAGDEIRAVFQAGARTQRVKLAVRGDRLVLTSVVLERQAVEAMVRDKLARMAWERNSATDLVTFAFDQEGRLVGRVIHPIETLDQAEFDLYVLSLLGECDGFEYVLSGGDAG